MDNDRLTVILCMFVMWVWVRQRALFLPFVSGALSWREGSIGCVPSDFVE